MLLNIYNYTNKKQQNILINKIEIKLHIKTNYIQKS